MAMKLEMSSHRYPLDSILHLFFFIFPLQNFDQQTHTNVNIMKETVSVKKDGLIFSNMKSNLSNQAQLSNTTLPLASFFRYSWQNALFWLLPFLWLLHREIEPTKFSTVQAQCAKTH